MRMSIPVFIHTFLPTLFRGWAGRFFKKVKKGGVQRVSRFRVGLVANGGVHFSRVGLRAFVRILEIIFVYRLFAVNFL